ncbi:MAG: pyridoxal-dependent decarboxylase [Pseudomonadota bacterium]|nr:pyridoxal-dependent decarboxylase [Pseudomonadota bacterium]
MTVSYQQQLQTIRRLFAEPSLDTKQDAYLVATIADAVKNLCATKTGAITYADEEAQPDFELAKQASLAEHGMRTEEVVSLLLSYCRGSVIAGHEYDQRNVDPVPTIASLVGSLYDSILTTNLAWDEHSHLIAQAEVECCAMLARLIGYDCDKSKGISTFGGSGVNLYSIRIGLEKAVPNAIANGLRHGGADMKRIVVFGAEGSHWSVANAAAVVGIGRRNVIKIPVAADGSMCVDALYQQASRALKKGEQIAAIVANAGTTTDFAFDDLEAISQVRDKLVQEFSLPYSIHVHADSVISWVWSVFSNYDFAQNKLQFEDTTLYMLQNVYERVKNLHYADSVGIDFHKMGCAPYISSFAVNKDGNDFNLLQRDDSEMPYVGNNGKYFPGKFSIETSRNASGVLSAFATMKALGRQGYQVILGHLSAMNQQLRQQLDELDWATVLNFQNHGVATIIRLAPDNYSYEDYQDELNNSELRATLIANNQYNLAIYENIRARVYQDNISAISLITKHQAIKYGDKLLHSNALKVYFTSPFTTAETVEKLIEHLRATRLQLSSKQQVS